MLSRAKNCKQAICKVNSLSGRLIDLNNSTWNIQWRFSASVSYSCFMNDEWLNDLWWLMVMGWCTGLLWQACMQVYRVGMRKHFVDIYNATDFFMLKFYTASLVLRRLADLKVSLFRLLLCSNVLSLNMCSIVVMCETYSLKATGLSNTVVNHLKLYG